MVDADRQIEALEDQRAAAMLGDGPDAVDSRVTLPTGMGIYWGYMGNYIYMYNVYIFICIIYVCNGLQWDMYQLLKYYI